MVELDTFSCSELKRYMSSDVLNFGQYHFDFGFNIHKLKHELWKMMEQTDKDLIVYNCHTKEFHGYNSQEDFHKHVDKIINNDQFPLVVTRRELQDI